MVVKFENGNNRCGLASLNQILSVLNPGNNKLLKGFIDKYNTLLNNNNNKNKVYKDPAVILKTLLNNNTNDIQNDKKDLLETKFVDVVEKYEDLFYISKKLKCNINDVNAYITLPENKKKLQETVKEISSNGGIDFFGRDPKINDNTLNLILCCDSMRIFDNFSQGICNESLSIDNSEF